MEMEKKLNEERAVCQESLPVGQEMQPALSKAKERKQRTSLCSFSPTSS